jgi:hypothetical protein
MGGEPGTIPLFIRRVGMDNRIIVLAQTALDRCGINLRVGEVGEPFAYWLACAELSAQWGGAHPLYILHNSRCYGAVGAINTENIAQFAYNWAWLCRPGEWDCDGFFCSESVHQEWLEELEIRIRSLLVQG